MKEEDWSILESPSLSIKIYKIRLKNVQKNFRIIFAEFTQIFLICFDEIFVKHWKYFKEINIETSVDDLYYNLGTVFQTALSPKIVDDLIIQ